MRPLNGRRKMSAVLKCYKHGDITLKETIEILENPDRHVWTTDMYPDEENIVYGRSKTRPVVIDPDND